jgi:carnitine O-acetyltransferase
VNAEWSDRTFGNEDRLPRVPLPTLAHSCERFLEWCAPLLTAEQFEATRAEVARFQEDPGPTLHAALQRFDASPGVRSWLDRFWPRRYLGRRDRIALNANFFFMFADPPAGGSEDPQVARAAELIASVLDFKRRLDREEIPPIVQRGQALSMEQFKFLFSETRIPQTRQDTVRVPYTEEWPGPSTERHIVVFFRGNMVRLEVLGADGTAVHNGGPGGRAAGRDEGRRAAGPAGHLGGPPDDEGAGGVGGQPPGAAGGRSGQPAALDTLETGAVLRLPGGLHAGRPVGHVRPPAARRQWQPVVRQVVVVHRVRRRPGRPQRGALRPGRDGDAELPRRRAHHPRAGERTAAGPAAGGAGAVRAGRRAAGGHRRGRRVVRRLRGEHASTIVTFDDFGADRAKALRMSAGRVRADGRSSWRTGGPRAFIGATYESIATRQFQNGRTEAMRVVHARGADVRGHNGRSGRGRRRPPGRAAGRRRASTWSGPGSARPATRPSSICGSCCSSRSARARSSGCRSRRACTRTPGWLIMRDDYLSTSSAPS